MAAELILDDDAVVDIAESSDGFSFAYLRELFLSSSVRWISDGAIAPFSTVLTAQLGALREQMMTAPSDAAEPSDFPGLAQPAFIPPHMLGTLARRAPRRASWTPRP